MDTVYFILQLTLASAIPLAIVAYGGLFSERSGIINIALEGMMIIGGFVGALVISSLEGEETSQFVALFGILVAGLAGAIFSLLHSYASINLKSNQVISGTALNILAAAGVLFIARSIWGAKTINLLNTYQIASVPVLSKIPVIGDIFFTKAYVSTYLCIVLFIVSIVVLYKTKFGLRLRACGENPHAADSVGVNVTHMRYAGVTISGFFAGIGGAIFAISFGGAFDGQVLGFGFLALGVLIFGNWNPYRILFAAFFFGFFRIISSVYFKVPLLNALELEEEIYKMIPYIITLIVLAITSKNSSAPRAEGEPYDPGKR